MDLITGLVSIEDYGFYLSDSVNTGTTSKFSYTAGRFAGLKNRQTR